MKTRMYFAATFLTVLSLIMFALSANAHRAIATTATLAQPTATYFNAKEKYGGWFAYPGTLYCPADLSGIGPTWRGITIGVSTLDDLKLLFRPYSKHEEMLLPEPTPTNVSGSPFILTQLYQINVKYLQDKKPELGLPDYMQACIVDNKVAALAIYNWDDPTHPRTIDQWVSLLGQRPRSISWIEGEVTGRLLHWPQQGISVLLDDQVNTYFTYYYPYQDIKNINQWPLNALLLTPPYDQKPSELEPNWLDFSAIETAQKEKPEWPTRTPSPPTQTPTSSLP